jgi:hypothetical protein
VASDCCSAVLVCVWFVAELSGLVFAVAGFWSWARDVTGANSTMASAAPLSKRKYENVKRTLVMLLPHASSIEEFLVRWTAAVWGSAHSASYTQP